MEVPAVCNALPVAWCTLHGARIIKPNRLVHDLFTLAVPQIVQ